MITIDNSNDNFTAAAVSVLDDQGSVVAVAVAVAGSSFKKLKKLISFSKHRILIILLLRGLYTT